MLFLTLAGSATSLSGLIVIRGPESGSHLRLTVSDSQLLVDGPLGGELPTGCRLTRPHAASCNLESASGVLVEMGSSNDKITVIDPLPIPLTAYLGGGSDKLIGNAEADTCYPQGTPRNRCIGNGGDDICISAPINTDCVGGPGNDYCRTSDGSDGCWGGPGSDICLMGDGMDGCHGDAGNDKLYGGRNGDRLYGGGGKDHCDGGPGQGRSRTCEAGPQR
jgi:hypothetical protein